MKNIIFILLFCLVLAPLTGCSQEKMPTDEHLQNLLETNRDSYQRAVDEFLLKGLYRLEIMSNGELNAKPKTVDNASIIDMKKLLRDDLHIDLINTSAKKDTYDLIVNEIAFFNYRRGLVFAGEHKGLVYVIDDASIQTTTQLNEIDREDSTMHKKRLYRFLEPHWYIFYEYFP